MANTLTYNRHDYITKLRERLNKPVNWTECMNVIYSDSRTIVNSILSTEPAVQTLTRGTAYTYQDFALTADTLTINTDRVIPILIDEADRYQQTYFQQMEIADYQGKLINEYMQAQVLAQHASWRDFGVGDLNNTSSNDTTQITVSATNIANLCRAIKRKVYANNGVELAVERGFFIVWRPADYELLEQFVQANGFSEADVALKNGVPVGMKYLGIEHYLSNDHTANHLFAGVKKAGKDIGILRSTFGQVKFIEDPGLVSGLGVVSRVDYGFSFPTAGPTGQALLDMSVDVNVV
jgi:hypothetical protein